jgi:hypothetical protein
MNFRNSLTERGAVLPAPAIALRQIPIPLPESGANDVGAAVTPAPTVAPRGVFGSSSKIGVRQYSWFASDWRNRQMRMDLDSPSARSANPVSSREVSWPMVEQETRDRVGGVRRRGFVRGYAAFTAP